MLLRCRDASANLRLLFALIALLLRITLGDWARALARALPWNTSRAPGRVQGRLTLLLLREQPWVLMLYALCLLVADTRPSR